MRERLGHSPYLPLSPAANKLVDFMALMTADRTAPSTAVDYWAPLLFEALDLTPPSPRSRLAGLRALVEADPGSSWTTATMASRAGLSISRLHAIFREELDTTPIAWLSDLRLERVRDGLRSTRHSIAELAYRNGYADQSALTRAMRRETGLTPGAYRRQAQEPGTRKR
ncbi:helix-turn-helix domain-containing protein [Sphingomonas colocasiae]|uniref:helix-turn-helix domain-containing protein n=1 Tax=Sphingomonas colocasiae TaxID=1848973 RepID=UPI001FE9E42D|nr:AraC family transcriptional regulator [Sphingomonas colocasiae]